MREAKDDMRIEKDKLATALAISAASLFIAGCNKKCGGSNTPDDAAEPAPASSAEVKCFGINECKGQSACDVEGAHVCGGQNECAGKGWILVPESECTEKGGEIV